MKIKLLSDLHLEFPKSSLELSRDDADLLILGGDICTAYDISDFLPFFHRASNTFPHIVYIAGNHEHYRSTMNGATGSLETLFNCARQFPNVHFLENRAITINGVSIFGATLWTDCNKRCPVTMEVLDSAMNDYRRIKREDSFRLRPIDTARFHDDTLRHLKQFLYENNGHPCIVATHHAPSKRSVNERYVDEAYMNGGYSSDLDYIMHDHPEIKLWTHGHTHDSFDYKINKTRVLCNPAGYPITGRDGKLYRENANFNPDLVVEI